MDWYLPEPLEQLLASHRARGGGAFPGIEMRLGAAEEEENSVVPGALSLPTRQAQPGFFGEVS